MNSPYLATAPRHGAEALPPMEEIPQRAGAIAETPSSTLYAPITDLDIELRNQWREAILLEEQARSSEDLDDDKMFDQLIERFGAAEATAYAMEAHSVAGLSIKLQQVLKAWDDALIVEKFPDLIRTALDACERLAPGSVIYKSNLLSQSISSSLRPVPAEAHAARPEKLLVDIGGEVDALWNAAEHSSDDEELQDIADARHALEDKIIEAQTTAPTDIAMKIRMAYRLIKIDIHGAGDGLPSEADSDSSLRLLRSALRDLEFTAADGQRGAE